MRLLLTLAILAGCSAVSDAPSATDGEDSRADDPPETVEEFYQMRADLVDRLDAAIGEARASNVAACRVIAVGAKACGGPAAYRVYSASDGDAAQVEALAREITDLDAYANDAFGLASTCDIAIEPSPALVGGRCTASGPR